MEKVIVIGCPGSGKSTLSIKLCSITGLPLYHLDMMYWNNDRTTVAKSVFMQRLDEALSGDRWIIDGNYGSTLEKRMSACDTVIFLDYPTEVCLEGVRSRRGKPRQDMPWIESEHEEDVDFLNFIKSYNSDSRPKVLQLLDEYSDKNIIILKSRSESEQFLSSIR